MQFCKLIFFSVKESETIEPGRQQTLWRHVEERYEKGKSHVSGKATAGPFSLQVLEGQQRKTLKV